MGFVQECQFLSILGEFGGPGDRRFQHLDGLSLVSRFEQHLRQLQPVVGQVGRLSAQPFVDGNRLVELTVPCQLGRVEPFDLPNLCFQIAFLGMKRT